MLREIVREQLGLAGPASILPDSEIDNPYVEVF